MAYQMMNFSADCHLIRNASKEPVWGQISPFLRKTALRRGWQQGRTSLSNDEFRGGLSCHKDLIGDERSKL